MGITTVGQLLSRAFEQPRARASLVVIGGMLGLLLSAAGIYSLISLTCSLRTQEVAIRVALGARSADVVALIGGEVMRLSVPAVLAGCLLAVAAARVFQHFLFGVEQVDAMSYTLATAIVIFAAAAASASPIVQLLKTQTAEILRAR
jgi:ABC-type antimicrobial peptide transport system permease subunit